MPYEGLGSIYWHMVSKLLLAVMETVKKAEATDASVSVVDGLTFFNTSHISLDTF